VPTFLEVWSPATHEVVELSGTRLVIGRDDANDVVLDDPKVSRAHAVLEHYPAGWSIADLGSRNGTYVNGGRILGTHALARGDEVRLGRSRLLVRSDEPRPGDDTLPETESMTEHLTRREREVLIALCRPVFSSEAFTQPASIREIAAELVVTEAAVKQHLVNLYDKLGIAEGEGRRVRLANHAISGGVISLADLHPS
jgi:pSer/pThr/pTyr-binding forkhead associated (FHA) protein